MRAILVATSVLASIVPMAALSQDQATPEAQMAPVEDLILARRVLMAGIDVYMQEIEAFVLDAETKGIPIPDEGREAADIVSRNLLAFPHLFTPGSIIWSQEAEAANPLGVSMALPAVWDNYLDFYERAQSASQVAADMSYRIGNQDAWIDSARDLRMACDSCHAEYSRLQPLDEIGRRPLPRSQ